MSTATSAPVPLYPLRETIKVPAEGGPPNREAVISSVSLILSSFVVAVAVKDGRLKGVDCDRLSYFISHETVVTSKKQPGMASWREEIFALMQRNAEETASYLCVPARQVMEVGAEMEV